MREELRKQIKREVADEIRQEEGGRMQEHAEALREEVRCSLDHNMQRLEESLLARINQRTDPMEQNVDNLTYAIGDTLYDDAAGVDRLAS